MPPSTPYNFGLFFFGLQHRAKWVVIFVEVPVVSFRTLRDLFLVATRNCIKYDKEAFYLTGLIRLSSTVATDRTANMFYVKRKNPPCNKMEIPYQVVAVTLIGEGFPKYVCKVKLLNQSSKIIRYASRNTCFTVQMYYEYLNIPNNKPKFNQY